MLIKLEEEKPIKYRLYQSEYTQTEIDKIFDGKEICTTCPFLLIWAGKVPEGTKELERGYCKFSHFSLTDLPMILGLSIDEAWKQASLIQQAISMHLML